MFGFKWLSRIVLALLAGILLACDGQPAGSTIQTQAVDVLRATAGGAWTSVPLGSSQPLNNGDSVSTSLQGEGLLKLPCAWLRVFRDTQLQFQQISVDGANLAGAKGAALVETRCVSFIVSNDSVPPEARIETHGTIFLAAFDRARHIVLLWTLDGTASLTNVQGDGTMGVTVSVSAGRWSVVRGRNSPEASRPVTEMDGILNEMNLWDVYEKVLQYVPSPRVATRTPTATPSRFISPSPTPTRSPTALPTHTPTPTPTQSPPPKVCQSGVLFCEDFEGPLPSGWRLEQGWQVVMERGNHILGGNGHGWATLTGFEWADYRVRFRLQVPRGTIHLNYRLRETPGRLDRYFIGFNEEGVSLVRQEGSVFTELTLVKAYHRPGSWHLVEIVGWGGRIVVYVNGQVELDYTDMHPLQRGGIAFETLDNSEALIDDIEVMPSGPMPVPTPTPTPTCPGPPMIPSFAASPPTIPLGGSSTLVWDPVQNADQVVIEPGIGRVPISDKRVVAPRVTTTYTLTATGCGGTRTRQTTIVVVQPGSVSGRVRDYRHDPYYSPRWIAKANVDIDGIYRTTTGSNGEFALSNVTPGEYRLTVSATGYESETVQIEVVSGRTTTVPDIVMYPTPNRSGSTSLLPNQCFDLDNGEISCDDVSGPDLEYRVSVSSVAYPPVYRYGISARGKATLESTTQTQIALSSCLNTKRTQTSATVTEGLVICFTTSSNRLAAIRVKSLSAAALVFEWASW
jgi:hypothetical protein